MSESLKHAVIKPWGPGALAHGLEPDIGARVQKTPVSEKTVRIFHSQKSADSRANTQHSGTCVHVRLTSMSAADTDYTQLKGKNG